MHTGYGKAFLALPILFLLGALLGGCAGPLKVEYSPPAEKESSARSLPARAILVRPFRDARSAKKDVDPRVVGEIKTTTQDIYGSRLVLDEPPARLVSDSLRKYLAGTGYRVVDEDQGGAGFSGLELGGEVRRFVLDVGPKDRIDISLYMELREGGGGKVLWSGVVEKKDSRYAGVFGASRSNLSGYISGALTDIFAEAMDRARIALRMDGGEATMKVEGREEGANAESVEAPQGSEATGGLIIRTTPGRAKVYIDGVYYGLSPLDLRLRPGIYALRLIRDGYVEFREKVAVDSGRNTEVEEKLRRKGD